MGEIIIFLALLALGYSVGTYAEKSHYKDIEKRELSTVKTAVVTMKNCFDDGREIESANLVTGSVVISIDYFKRFLAKLRNIFGGNVKSYETLVDRGRREAILRMKAQMPSADIIVNMRVETSTIGRSANNKNTVGSIEVFAYGTAVRYKKEYEVQS
jgi:uncharacterized protein YbjQ (UPF0145 family)